MASVLVRSCHAICALVLIGCKDDKPSHGGALRRVSTPAPAKFRVLEIEFVGGKCWESLIKIPHWNPTLSPTLKKMWFMLQPRFSHLSCIFFVEIFFGIPKHPCSSNFLFRFRRRKCSSQGCSPSGASRGFIFKHYVAKSMSCKSICYSTVWVLSTTSNANQSIIIANCGPYLII